MYNEMIVYHSLLKSVRMALFPAIQNCSSLDFIVQRTPCCLDLIVQRAALLPELH